MKNETDFMQAVAKDAFAEVVKRTVEGFFRDRWGYGSQEDVQKALKDAIEEMVKTDPDIRARIKKRLLEVIEKGESRS